MGEYDGWLTLQDAAAQIGVNAATVGRLCLRGEIPSRLAPLQGRPRMIHPDDFAAYFGRAKVGPRYGRGVHWKAPAPLAFSRTTVNRPLGSPLAVAGTVEGRAHE